MNADGKEEAAFAHLRALATDYSVGMQCVADFCKAGGTDRALQYLGQNRETGKDIIKWAKKVFELCKDEEIEVT